jgi:hypothetical protein
VTVTKHYGPGDHPGTGTPQTEHGRRGGASTRSWPRKPEPPGRRVAGGAGAATIEQESAWFPSGVPEYVAEVLDALPVELYEAAGRPAIVVNPDSEGGWYDMPLDPLGRGTLRLGLRSAFERDELTGLQVPLDADGFAQLLHHEMGHAYLRQIIYPMLNSGDLKPPDDPEAAQLDEFLKRYASAAWSATHRETQSLFDAFAEAHPETGYPSDAADMLRAGDPWGYPRWKASIERLRPYGTSHHELWAEACGYIMTGHADLVRKLDDAVKEQDPTLERGLMDVWREHVGFPPPVVKHPGHVHGLTVPCYTLEPFAKHYGPGDHPSGSPQSVHGGDGGRRSFSQNPFGDDGDMWEAIYERRTTGEGYTAEDRTAFAQWQTVGPWQIIRATILEGNEEAGEKPWPLIHQLDAAVARRRTTEPLYLIRGYSYDAAEFDGVLPQPGDVFENPNFTAAGVSWQVAEGYAESATWGPVGEIWPRERRAVYLGISVPPGTPVGLPMLAGPPAWRVATPDIPFDEVILPRNSKFRVLRVLPATDGVTIHVELISEFQVRKHYPGRHDQRDHGNWARGTRSFSQNPDSPLRTFLEQVASIAPRSFEAVVLARGTSYTPPSSIEDNLRLMEQYGIEPGQPKECFENAGRAVLDDTPGVTYVEGYAQGSIIPVHHAWLVTDDGQVIDPTWGTGRNLPGFEAIGPSPPGEEYFGIPVGRDELVAILLGKKTWGAWDWMAPGRWPGEVAKHYPGRHDQKDHGNWARDGVDLGMDDPPANIRAILEEWYADRTELLRSAIRRWKADPGRVATWMRRLTGDEPPPDMPKEQWNVDMYAYRLEAQALLNALHWATPSQQELWRGQGMRPEVVPEVGDVLDIPFAPTTPDSGVASDFAQKGRLIRGGDGTWQSAVVVPGGRQVVFVGVLLKFMPGTSAVPIQRLDDYGYLTGSFYDEDEHLVTGQFRVTEVRWGGYREGWDASHPDWAEVTLEPVEVAKHYGPGPHPGTGTPQTEHAGEGTGTIRRWAIVTSAEEAEDDERRWLDESSKLSDQIRDRYREAYPGVRFVGPDDPQDDEPPDLVRLVVTHNAVRLRYQLAQLQRMNMEEEGAGPRKGVEAQRAVDEAQDAYGRSRLVDSRIREAYEFLDKWKDAGHELPANAYTALQDIADEYGHDRPPWGQWVDARGHWESQAVGDAIRRVWVDAPDLVALDATELYHEPNNMLYGMVSPQSVQLGLQWLAARKAYDAWVNGNPETLLPEYARGGEEGRTLRSVEYIGSTRDWRAYVQHRLDHDVDLDQFEDGFETDDYERMVTEEVLPVIPTMSAWIRLTADGLEDVLDDGRFKSQHEAGRSNGVYNPHRRDRFEEQKFGEYEADHQRPIYGYLDSEDGYLQHRDGRSVSVNDVGYDSARVQERLYQYGLVAVRLKDHVKQRTSFTVGDSLDQEDNIHPSWMTEPQVWSVDPYVVAPKEPTSPVVYNDDPGTWPLYAEAQVHGAVRVEDIAEVVVPRRPAEGDAEADLFERLEALDIPVRWLEEDE